MALTLPSEVSTEKDKQGYAPVVLIEFADLAYYIATREYTLSLTAGGTRDFLDLTDSGSSVGAVTVKAVEGMNRNASVASVTLKLADYRGSLRTNVIASEPNLTGSAVNLYLKFKTSSTAEANRLKFFSGTVRDYSVDGDKMTLRVEAGSFKGLGDLPATALLNDEYDFSAAPDNYVLPLQYGNFNWDADPLFQTDIIDSGNSYAVCPYVGRDENGKYVFAVAGHAMENMPSATDLQTFLYQHAFIRRDGRFVTIKDSGAVVTNGASVSDVRFKFGNTDEVDDYRAVWIYPTELYSGGSGNNPSDAGLCIDGKAATTTTAGGTSGHRIKVAAVPIDTFAQNNITGRAKPYIYIAGMGGSSPYGYATLRRKSDNTSAGQLELNSGTTTGAWIQVGLVDVSDGNTVNDYYMEIQPTGANEIEMTGIIWEVTVQNYDPLVDDPFVYLRCKGREFSGTWDGRKTSGNPIDHPVDMLESIYRDELGKSAIDTTAFDAVAARMSGYKVAASIWERESAEALLDRVADQFNICNVITNTDTVSVAIPDDGLNFTRSGSGTPGDEDIFTDSEVVTSGAFDKHPIKEGGLKLGRSTAPLVEKLTTRYGRTGDGYIYTVTSGSGTETVMSCDFSGHKATATAINTFIRGWRGYQRWIATVTTFLNAIGFQIGDIANIRDGDLNDNMLPATVNTQKWICAGVKLEAIGDEVELKFYSLP